MIRSHIILPLVLFAAIILNVYVYYTLINPVPSIIASPTSAPRVLYCIAASSAQRLDVLERLLANAVDWCEGGYDVSIIIDSFDVKYQQYISSLRTHCTRKTVSLQVIIHPNTTNLVTTHRAHFLRYLHSFDIFVYSEDDMSIRLSNLQHWRHETSQLGRHSTEYMIGMLRYENALATLRSPQAKKVEHFHPKYDASDQLRYLRNKITWEANLTNYYLLNRRSTAWVTGIKENYYIASHDLPYAAAYIATSQQLQSLESRCLFLSQQTAYTLPQFTGPDLREFYSSLQPIYCSNMTSSGIFRAPVGRGIYSPEFFCCMKWLLPADHMESLFIHHIGSPGGKAEHKWLYMKKRTARAVFLETWYDWLREQKTAAL